MPPRTRRIQCRMLLAAVPLLGIGLAGTGASCHSDYRLWAGDQRPIVAASRATKTVAGELATLTSKRMAVETRSDTVLLHVADHIKVTIDGRKAALGDLEQRQFVEVTAREQGTDLVASAVAARSKM